MRRSALTTPKYHHCLFTNVLQLPLGCLLPLLFYGRYLQDNSFARHPRIVDFPPLLSWSSIHFRFSILINPFTSTWPGCRGTYRFHVIPERSSFHAAPLQQHRKNIQAEQVSVGIEIAAFPDCGKSNGRASSTTNTSNAIKFWSFLPMFCTLNQIWEVRWPFRLQTWVSLVSIFGLPLPAWRKSKT